MRAVVLHSDMRRTGWFESSHDLLNRLHENVVWSMRGNFLSVPTDCPQRDERMGWTGDVQVFAPTAATLFDSSAFLANWLTDLAFEQGKRDGVVPFVVPDVLRFPVGPTAAWGDAATVVPTVLADRFGDEGILARQFESMKAWVDSILPHIGDDGLWEGHIQLGDWLDPEAPPEAPGAAKTPSDIVATAHLFRSSDLVARAARGLGRDDVADTYAAIAERTRAAFLAAYVTPQGRMTADAPTAYALALAFGIAVDPEQRQLLGDRLAHTSRRHAFHIATGFVGTPLVLDALVDTGHADVAGTAASADRLPFVAVPGHDGCDHHLGTMGLDAAGRLDQSRRDDLLQPLRVRLRRGLAVPTIGRHRTCGARIPSHPLRTDTRGRSGSRERNARHPSGRVVGGWEREDDTLRLHLTVPAHSTAEVLLPDGTRSEVGPGAALMDHRRAAEPRSALFRRWGRASARSQTTQEALAAVLGVLREHDPAYEALVRRRIDWNVTDPLPAGLFDMPPAMFGELAGALAALSGSRTSE